MIASYRYRDNLWAKCCGTARDEQIHRNLLRNCIQTRYKKNVDKKYYLKLRKRAEMIKV